jgi:hypothetical protein
LKRESFKFRVRGYDEVYTAYYEPIPEEYLIPYWDAEDRERSFRLSAAEVEDKLNYSKWVKIDGSN